MSRFSCRALSSRVVPGSFLVDTHFACLSTSTCQAIKNYVPKQSSPCYVARLMASGMSALSFASTAGPLFLLPGDPFVVRSIFSARSFGHPYWQTRGRYETAVAETTFPPSGSEAAFLFFLFIFFSRPWGTVTQLPCLVGSILLVRVGRNDPDRCDRPLFVAVEQSC